MKMYIVRKNTRININILINFFIKLKIPMSYNDKLFG